MFSQQEIELLLSEDVRRAIEQNLMRNPADIALDKRVEHAALVATQVKRLQRAATKLPTLYGVRALLPALGYEQSSSEACAARKPLEGDAVLDLTCGLGIDAMALARRFKRVVAVERNEMLCRVVRENFARLGVENVEVVNSSAEEYLATCTDHFDWCFADPDRRNAQGRKLVCLEDCSPDILSLREHIARVADRLCVKCSPLFDVDEAFRLFGNCRVEVVSMGGECKEVNIYTAAAEAEVAAVAIGIGEVCHPMAQRPECNAPQHVALEEYRFLVVPDVAVAHARMVGCMASQGIDVWSNRGVGLAKQMPQGVVGRVFEIAQIHPFDIKRLRGLVRGHRVEIMRRDFPLSNQDICRKLGCSEGGTERWCMTSLGGQKVAIELKN